MADRMLAERLQPSLLDRLTDHAPGNETEAASNYAIDIGRLREIIQRDLAWLLNTANIAVDHDLELRPNVARSVLNYGIPGLSGLTHTSNQAFEIQQAIRLAIETFEPRILPETLDVSLRRQDSGSRAIISLEIRGELWAEPVPVDLYLRTALDVTSGQVTITRQG
ncbi:type VI secretion system baseplate subunit TssE [Rhizobium halophytocola]|uniref:Type VI secretion system protein ImpF n=1 Tax=Rhizobium halophytocola TaxID=735519 RepID=A0ABS4E3H1_9HYPH|nr:type VI secretion system baseplate subunit TssE [Rhizobium halophytocola]MBP1852483.1 type VI secretion system protein ImpF [Rhizobium halophytocola]